MCVPILLAAVSVGHLDINESGGGGDRAPGDVPRLSNSDTLAPRSKLTLILIWGIITESVVIRTGGIAC